MYSIMSPVNFNQIRTMDFDTINSGKYAPIRIKHHRSKLEVISQFTHDVLWFSPFYCQPLFFYVVSDDKFKRDCLKLKVFTEITNFNSVDFTAPDDGGKIFVDPDARYFNGDEEKIFNTLKNFVDTSNLNVCPIWSCMIK